MSQQKIPLAAVVGPTASGKTGLAIALCQALGGEVVSGDSMQLYRELSIATAKPTPAQRAQVPHHLIDLIQPWESFSVARYTALAREAVAEIHSRGRLPVVAGGTGLYIRALLSNITFAPQRQDEPYRQRLRLLAAEQGGGAVHSLLREVDPEAAEAIHPNNLGRVIRALEVCHTSGLTMTAQQERSHREPSPYNACILGVGYRDRETLCSRIDRRVDLMLEAGLLEEARRVLAMELSPTAAQAIGYKELAPYFAGEISLERAVAEIKLRSRQYAKRQMTWFRRESGICWLWAEDYAGPEALALAAEKQVRAALQL